MKKILIIEDDELLMQMYSQRLKASNYHVLQATDGKTGLNMVHANMPDLVLLDIMLPGGMNGFDVLEDLKKNDATKHIPVIMHTSLDTEAKTAHAIGANAYFIKSQTNLDDLADKVDELLA